MPYRFLIKRTNKVMVMSAYMIMAANEREMAFVADAGDPMIDCDCAWASGSNGMMAGR